MISSKNSISCPLPLKSEAGLMLVLRILAACTIALLGLVILFLIQESWAVLRHVGIWRFLTDTTWHPTENSYAMVPMLVGSLASSLGAVLIAGPLGLGAALFCSFYAPRSVAGFYRRILGVLAGTPSVVFGFWGLTVLVPLIATWEPPGASLMAGIAILALMILPTVTLTSEAALSAVPESYLNGARALGISRGAMIVKIVLHSARGGILAGIVLAIARALGETMAIFMVSGNIVQVPTSLFDPVRTLSANIALEMAYAVGNHRSALYVSGVVLIAVVGVLVLLAEKLSGNVKHV
jgi:phosphate transport system permease protein